MILRLALGAFVAANVLANAGLLWLACRLCRVGGVGSPVGYRQGLLLTVTIFLVGWPPVPPSPRRSPRTGGTSCRWGRESPGPGVPPVSQYTRPGGARGGLLDLERIGR